jgi:hypothetical protein
MNEGTPLGVKSTISRYGCNAVNGPHSGTLPLLLPEFWLLLQSFEAWSSYKYLKLQFLPHRKRIISLLQITTSEYSVGKLWLIILKSVRYVQARCTIKCRVCRSRENSFEALIWLRMSIGLCAVENCGTHNEMWYWRTVGKFRGVYIFL